MRWTQDDINVLVASYPDTPTVDIAKRLGRSERSVYFQAFRIGLKKSSAYFSGDNSGQFKPGTYHGNRFKPGQRPWNAGMHGYQPGGRSAETRFKAGRKPEEARNYRPIGSIRLTKDGYCERKVTDNQDVYPARRWVPVHRLVWEEVHGPVKKGMIVVFKLGMLTNNPDEITIDRLELITRQENMQRNTVHRLPKEIVQLVQLRSVLVRKINERAKE